MTCQCCGRIYYLTGFQELIGHDPLDCVEAWKRESEASDV